MRDHPIPAAPEATDARAVPIRVLLVEDSHSDAILLRESLAHASSAREFAFTQVNRWADAAKRLAQDEFDAMLLDLSLPDVSGRDTFLRARAEAPHLPIVVLTAETNEAMGLEAVRHGIQDYLIKGQTYGRHTVRAIRYAIERKQVEEALQRTEAALRESERRLRESNADLERRVAERTASLQETIADLEDFSHSITHDLRAPLRAIRSFAQILQEECLLCGRPGSQDNLRRIITAAARMDKLIQDVLQYSRLARSDLRLAPVDSQVLLDGIVDTYPAFKPPRVEIETRGRLPRVLGNEAALTQCFSNLLGNAVKFVAAGVQPRVRIWAEPIDAAKAKVRATSRKRGARAAAAAPVRLAAAPFVRLWFEDNGIGIPEDARDRIFGMFQRLDKSYEGTGVGLTVVRKAVEKMGGRVGVESTPGAGSRFWLELRTAPVREPGRAAAKLEAS